MTAPPANAESTALTTRVEVRAQSFVITFLAAAMTGSLLQMAAISRQLSDMNGAFSRDIGSLSANVATLTELARDHTDQLRDLDRRLTSIETHLAALTEAVNRIAPKSP